MFSKKETREFLVVLLICAVVWFMTSMSEDERRLPSVPSEQYNHELLDGRMDGNCKTLTGNVAVTVIISSDNFHPWKAEDVETKKEAVYEALEMTERAALQYGAALELTAYFIEVTGNQGFPVGESTDKFIDWAEITLQRAGLGASDQVSQTLKSRYGADEVPILFMVNELDRSHVRGAAFESAVCFRNASAGTVAHELAHLFGAADFYYPEAVAELCRSYFPDSLMLSSANTEQGFDELTAYLVGWTDSPSPTALAFLQQSKDFSYDSEDYTMVINRLDGADAAERGASRGAVAWSNGTYTGDLYGGWPHGEGVLVIDVNGKQAKYVGEFVHGEQEGYGTYYYTDGSTFAGYWKQSRQNGQGVYTHADGSVTSGTWENGQCIRADVP